MKSLVLSLLFVLVLAGPARAQSLTENLKDARIVARATVALAQDEDLRAFTFQPTVNDVVVTVAGAVQTQAQKERVAEVVGGLDGVRRVVNDVRVTAAAGATAPELPPVEPAPDSTATEETEPEPEPEPEPEKVYHTVRRGDTLIAIARRYGVSVSQVRQLNGLRGSRIRAGQRLRVK